MRCGDIQLRLHKPYHANLERQKSLAAWLLALLLDEQTWHFTSLGQNDERLLLKPLFKVYHFCPAKAPLRLQGLHAGSPWWSSLPPRFQDAEQGTSWEVESIHMAFAITSTGGDEPKPSISSYPLGGSSAMLL